QPNPTIAVAVLVGAFLISWVTSYIVERLNSRQFRIASVTTMSPVTWIGLILISLGLGVLAYTGATLSIGVLMPTDTAWAASELITVEGQAPQIARVVAAEEG